MLDNITILPEIDSMRRLDEVQGIYADAVLSSGDDQLLFCSLWGRDTAIRELQARLTLGASEGGLKSLNVPGDGNRTYLAIGEIESISQQTARIKTNILGELVHLILFQTVIVKPDLANHRAFLVGDDISEGRLSSMIKAICPIPLLDYWIPVLLPALEASQMVKRLSGWRINGVQIALDPGQVASMVKQDAIEGKLTISNGAAA